MKNKWFANGKLLITGEYLVMHGARALAVPLKYGQSLTVTAGSDGLLRWQADVPGKRWFETVFQLPSLEICETSDNHMAGKLRELLRNAVNQNAYFLGSEKGLNVTTQLDFPSDYGFGSSSTLVYCVARWAGVNPYLLQQQTFGGSGYDIACAEADGPIIFQRTGNKVQVTQPEFSPPFKNYLYFVYLGKKQHTAQSVRDFEEKAFFSEKDIQRISSVTDAVLRVKNLEGFEKLLTEHEQLIASVLEQPTVKELRFPGYGGAVKSLGAWGGDFALVTTKSTKKHFIREMNGRGFQVIYPFSDLVL